MKKKITIYFKPIKKNIEVPDYLNEYEINQKINDIVYDIDKEKIEEQAEIHYWEED